MEKWDVCCAPCRATPSCCLVRTPAFPSSLAVLSNGSMFLYLLDLTKRKQYAVLKFASQVVHVSSMHSRDEPDGSVVLCCLASGEIATFCITTVVKRVRERREERRSEASAADPEEDLFVSLLEEPPSANTTTTTTTTTTTRSPWRSEVISGDRVTVGIGMCPPALGWNLISAVVLDDCMVMCRQCAASGETSHLLLRSGRSVPLLTGGQETVTVPSFVASQQLQVLADVTATTSGCLAAGGNGVVKGGQRVKRSPAFAIVQSESHAPRRHHTITSELFAGLFGLESELSKNPVLLIGCQNGNIYFTNFRSQKSSLEESSSTSQQEVLRPLHSLEQPVVGIHSAYFPVRKPADAEADPFLLRDEGEGTEWQQEDSNQDVHNALLFLGLRGRVSVCYVVSPPPSSTLRHHHHHHLWQSSLGFVDFHIPAPVLSSVLVQDRCLLYGTLGGALYRVCLRERCAQAVEGHVPRSSLPTDLPLMIPETSFKFPEKVLDSEWAWHLLLVVGVGSEGGGARRVQGAEEEREGVACLCCSLDGRMTTLRVAGPNTTSPAATATAEAVVSRTDSAQVGREVKQCLQAIQAWGERLEGVAEEMLSLGAVLAELKHALDILCSCDMMGRSTDSWSLSRAAPQSCTPEGHAFSCSFQCTWEELGTSGEGLGVVVELRRSSSGGMGGVVMEEPALGKGWSLVVMSVVSSSGSGRVTSKSLQIAGLACGQSVTLRVDVDGAAGGIEGAGHLGGVVNCFVHYDPHHLCEKLQQQQKRKSLASGGVSLFLARKEFDLLDYLRPLSGIATSTSHSSSNTNLRGRLSSLQLAAIRSLLTSLDKGRVEGGVDKQAPPSLLPLPHTCTLTIPLGTATTLIRSSKGTRAEEDLQRLGPGGMATELLTALLPQASASDIELAAGQSTMSGAAGGGFPDLLTSLDGECVRFKLSGSSDKTLGHRDTATTALKLEIHASSTSCLARVTSAVNRRRLEATESEAPLSVLSRQEACGSLQRLRRVLDETGQLVREVSSSHHQQQLRRGPGGAGCCSVDIPSRTLQDWRDRTAAIYCKLREWPG